MKKILLFLVATLFATDANAITKQQEGALSALDDARMMKIINDHCHYVSTAETDGFVKSFEQFAGIWIKQFPEFDGSYHQKKMRTSFAGQSKANIKKFCDDPMLKKYFMSMYNTYASGE